MVYGRDMVSIVAGEFYINQLNNSGAWDMWSLPVLLSKQAGKYSMRQASQFEDPIIYSY